eukprot:1161762-Pelagomonas_calceolata.AAC.13
MWRGEGKGKGSQQGGRGMQLRHSCACDDTSTASLLVDQLTKAHLTPSPLACLDILGTIASQMHQIGRRGDCTTISSEVKPGLRSCTCTAAAEGRTVYTVQWFPL